MNDTFPESARIHGDAWRAYQSVIEPGDRDAAAWELFLAGWLAKADQRLAIRARTIR